MKFPGRRKNKHYFPVTERDRPDIRSVSIEPEKSFYVVGIDQCLVDIECHLEDDEFLARHDLKKGQSQIIPESVTDRLLALLKSENRITGEFAGGTVGNTLHNFSVLSEERAVLLGSISRNITVGDTAFKYLAATSSKVDLNHLYPAERAMGRALCFISKDRERTFAISPGCMSDYPKSFLPEDLIQNASSLLVSAYLFRNPDQPVFETTLKACEVARAANVPIVFSLGTESLIAKDPSFFVRFIRDYVNVLAMNESEAHALTRIEDPLIALEQVLDWVDLSLLTVGADGLFVGGLVDEKFKRATEHEVRSGSIENFNAWEYSRVMCRKDCENPIKVYSHINPFLGGPEKIQNTNGAGDGALAAVLHDMSANRFHKAKVPNSPKHNAPYLTYSSISQICKYSNRVSFEILSRNSPRLFRGLPEREDSLDEAYWAT